MALTSTTLSQSISIYTTRFTLASTANINAPLYAGSLTEPNYLYCEQELMFVTGVPFSGTVTVRRGQLGTAAAAHAANLTVSIGLASDFPVTTLPREIASGIVALGTTAIGAGSQAATVTVSVPGVIPTDNIQADFNSDPTGVSGYTPATTGMLTIIKFCGLGTVNFIVANNTSASISPGAITLNWRVMR